VTEAELQEAIIEVAHLFRWTVAHFRPARTKHGWVTPVSADGKGFPDLVLVSSRIVAFIEVKSAKGRLTDEQKMWADLLTNIEEVHYDVWRPADLDDGSIVRFLKEMK